MLDIQSHFCYTLYEGRNNQVKAVNPLKQYRITALPGLIEFSHPATSTDIILTVGQARQLAMELNRAAASVSDDKDLMREKKNK